MFLRSFMSRRGSRFAGLLVLAISAQATFAHSQTPPIRFAAEVPALPPRVQAYKLAPTAPPRAFLAEKLTAARLPAPRLEGRVLTARAQGVGADLDRVRLYIDTATGDTHFIPNLAELVRPVPVRAPISIERLRLLGRAALLDARFLPKDVTETRVADAITVMGSQATRSPQGVTRTDVARRVMTIVPATRYAGGLRVYGRGSHAVVSLDNGGRVVGALRRWRTASTADMMETTLTADQVRADIQRQLGPTASANGAQVVVDKIELAYYDANGNYLNPVVRFEANISSPDKRISDTRIAGYVPLGRKLEAIPDLAAPPSGPTPGRTDRRASLDDLGPRGDSPTANDITLGEFANQDWPTSSAYLDMANNFLSGLSSGGQPVSRTIWWTAYPWQVNGPQSKQWMNAVNVAYTEPHGDWLINSTQSNCCQLWYVNQIGVGGNPGFGAAAGGVLATWIMMSCENIPSIYDRQHDIGGDGNGQHAFDAWWGVFQGLHNAIGFRTIMFYPDDSLNYGFGADAAHGGDVNAAWFNEVAAIHGGDGTYASQHLVGAPQVHYDRASTMIDARDLGQSIFAVGPQSASTTLWSFWMNN